MADMTDSEIYAELAIRVSAQGGPGHGHTDRASEKGSRLSAGLALRALNVTEETGRQVLASTNGFAARQAIAVLRKHNIPIAPLLKRAGISEGDVDNPVGCVSAMAQGMLLERAAEALGDHEFGLHLAEQANPRELGLLFYVASAAEDVGGALALAARYCRIVNEAMRLKLIRSPDGVTVETKFVGLPRHFAWQNTELLIAGMIKGLREMAGCDLRPKYVSLTLARNSEVQEFEPFFGCPVEFSASADRFGFSNETLAIPLITEDRRLLNTLQPICDAAAKERNTAGGTLRSSVENEVQKLLTHGKANKKRVAEALGLSERTLSQRLAEEETTYDHVVDRLRHGLALQYVKEPSLSLAQIAWLLGYEGPTSFNCAFARWTGRSASKARDEQQRSKV
jgi:AraC-like DNA-binding protein